MATIWMDAVDFQRYGGYVLDTQFIREMGQPYLLADGLGTPVTPAETAFSVDNGGIYRVWVRTKNWCPPHDPDGLRVEIDGHAAANIVGMMQVRGWHFDIGGDFPLEKGAHTLRIMDTTGWFGRFAAVVITDDMDFVPSPELSALKRQRARLLGLADERIEEGAFDLAVVGGGPGGFPAAIAAARHGLRVALINDRPLLGGNGADEGGVTFDGAACKGYHETGILYEVKALRHAENLTWSGAIERVVRAEPNLALFENMVVDGAVTEGNWIVRIDATHTRTLRRHTFAADQFVDATGDGWLGYYAGAKYRIGREARWQHQETFAPDTADLNTMSGCVMKKIPEFPRAIIYGARDAGRPVTFSAPDWAYSLPEGDALGREPNPPEKGAWWLENRNDYDDLWEQEYVRDDLIRVTVGFFHWMKNSWKDKEKAANLELAGVGIYNAKRENRRLVGDYILTQNDYGGTTDFPDAVAYCGWNLDVHHVQGIFSGADGLFTSDQVIPLTPLPFRCLYSVNIDNLFMAGRCASTSHVGLGSTRVQSTGATMGQAVGTAAALCKRYGVTPRQLGMTYIKQLQQELLKDGQTILGLRNRDPEDQALSATVEATSHTPGGEPENILNGLHRAWHEEPYAWISQPGFPQAITLSFEQAVPVREIRITFDADLTSQRYDFLPFPPVTGILSDFKVEICGQAGWKTAAAVTGNVQRMVILRLPETMAEKVRITALAAHGDEAARITEVRVY